MTELLPNAICDVVPQDAKEIVVENNQLRYFFLTYEVVIDLPPGNWRYICTYPGCTEEQAREVVEIGYLLFRDYEASIKVTFKYTQATDSLASLLRSKELDTNKHYVILKKEV